ncbi:RraA family protein (plasmid) [Rhodococcoides fascians]|uniref:RraA family protein n=1 Tax=Rhodococcoides fascians TaxID=1828 RepID=UPI00389A5928
MNSRPTADQLKRLRELGAATIYEAQGQRGSVSSVIRPIDPSMVLAGPALTVDCGPADNLMLHAALAHARSGDILVADAKGFMDAGAWGDILTAAAQKAGIAGLVINGCVRDATEIAEMHFPVFSLGLSIRGTTKIYKGAIGEPVTIVDTIVRNGDVVVGDRDGLVVIAAGELEESIVLAEQREAKEAAFRSEIENGVTTAKLLGLEDTLTSYFPR